MLRNLLMWPIRVHLLGSLGIVVVVSLVISAQVSNRYSFANSELVRDVMERWGAPIVQPAPSVRYVTSGAVFNTLKPLPLAGQKIQVQAGMNYRKRGLVYFSGFDFDFSGDYRVVNDRPHDVDLVFVFPIRMQSNQVLLSDFTFEVDGKAAAADMAAGQDKLVWTGRARAGQELSFHIGFRGRGLDSFIYEMDPDLPVRDFEMIFEVSGGDTYDYPGGVVSSDDVQVADGRVSLAWRHASLESGVPVGLILPREQAFDTVVAAMVRRGWAPFLAFFLGLTLLALAGKRRFAFYEAYLLSASFALFFVLLAYLAAFTFFALAFVISWLLVTTLLVLYLRACLGNRAGLVGLGLSIAFLLVPNLAVILEGFTGLIYTVEITFGLGLAMFLTRRSVFRKLLDELSLTGKLPQEGKQHAL